MLECHLWSEYGAGWRRAANNSLLFAFSPDEESSQKFIPFVGVSVVVVVLSQASWNMFSGVHLNLPGFWSGAEAIGCSKADDQHENLSHGWMQLPGI